MVILLAGSTITLIKVYFFRKRRDTFLLIVPNLYIVYAVLGFVEPVFQINKLADIPPVEIAYADPPAWIITLTVISTASYFRSHFMFAIQYLRTGLILPNLFTKAKIEWL